MKAGIMLKDNPRLWVRIKIFLWGSAFHHFQDLGTTKLEVRQTRCRWHGYYQDIRHGWAGYMECPICKKAREDKKYQELRNKELEKAKAEAKEKLNLEEQKLKGESVEKTDNGSGIEKTESSRRADNLPG